MSGIYVEAAANKIQKKTMQLRRLLPNTAVARASTRKLLMSPNMVEKYRNKKNC